MIYDVVIVGAGPSGASTAISLAEVGLRVALLDKARFPRVKPCAEYVNPEATALLNRLGLLDDLRAAGGVVFHGYFKNEQPATGDANALQRNGEAVGEKQYLTDAFTREAVAFIDKHKADPFFIYLPYNAPHTPLAAPPKYLSRFENVADEKRKLFRDNAIRFYRLDQA